MPIIITSATQLAQIGISPDYPGNGSYILGNDIQISGSWVSLPEADGLTLDGNGHRIYTLDAPLFFGLRHSTVSNLILNVDIDNTANNNPSCGLAQSVIFCTLQSISVTGSINSNLIAGGLCISALDCRFTDCHNYASVTNQHDLAGGLIAFTNDTSLINCVNNGAVTANNYHGGGLVGQFQTRGINYVGGPPSKFFVADCVNNAPVQSSHNGGGLIGLLGDDGFYLDHVNLGAEIRGCVNRGNVSPVAGAIGSPDGNNQFGGLVGIAVLGDPNGGGFFDCENSGDISGGTLVGGIAGYINVIRQEADTGNLYQYPLNNCLNSGSVTVSGLDSGGIAGRALHCTVINCVNRGVVSGTDNCGGIAGVILNGTRLLNNKSCATVISTGQFVGGIAGLTTTSAENGVITPLNEIRDNLVSSPAISGVASVYRVLGGSTDNNFSLFNTQVFPDILLSGNNSADGGLIYNNQPVAANDPQLGAELRQGATLVCAPGEHLKSCVGCVPQHTPCPCGECSCMPGRCRPCDGREGPCVSLEQPFNGYSSSSFSSPINGKSSIPTQVLRA